MTISDSSRKVFQVIYNYFNKNHSMPSLDWLSRISNRKQDEIMTACKELEAAGYLKWDGQSMESVTMLKLPNAESRETTAKSAQRYYMDY